MCIKNKISKKIFLILLSLIIFNSLCKAEIFDITANIVNIDKEKEIIDAEGSVVVIDETGNKITADKGVYFKSDESFNLLCYILIRTILWCFAYFMDKELILCNSLNKVAIVGMHL